MVLQNEKAFQKQPTVFLNRKKGLGGKRRKSLRYHREVGLGFKTPREVRGDCFICMLTCGFFFDLDREGLPKAALRQSKQEG